MSYQTEPETTVQPLTPSDFQLQSEDLKDIPEEFQTTQETFTELVKVDIPRFFTKVFPLLAKSTTEQDNVRETKGLGCKMLLVLRAKLKDLLSSADATVAHDIDQQIAQIDFIIGIAEYSYGDRSRGIQLLSDCLPVFRKRFVSIIFQFFFIQFFIVSDILLIHCLLHTFISISESTRSIRNSLLKDSPSSSREYARVFL